MVLPFFNIFLMVNANLFSIMIYMIQSSAYILNKGFIILMPGSVNENAEQDTY